MEHGEVDGTALTAVEHKKPHAQIFLSTGTRRQMSASPVEIGNKPQLIRKTKAIFHGEEEKKKKKSKKGPKSGDRHS